MQQIYYMYTNSRHNYITYVANDPTIQLYKYSPGIYVAHTYLQNLIHMINNDNDNNGDTPKHIESGIEIGLKTQLLDRLLKGIHLLPGIVIDVTPGESRENSSRKTTSHH